MRKFITSSVESTIKESAKLATKLNTGLEISRMPGVSRIDSNFEGILKDLKEQTSEFEGAITFHALFSDMNPASRDEGIRKVVYDRYDKSFIAAKSVNAEATVYHTGHKGMKHYESIENFVDGSIKYWSEAVKKFEDSGIVAVLENVHEAGPEIPIRIIDAVNSPYLKISLDTGHANLCSQKDPADWIKAYGKRLYHMHIHNNCKDNDSHAGFKYGTLNFHRILNTLKEENLSPLIVFEMFNREELIESIQIFDEIIPC